MKKHFAVIDTNYVNLCINFSLCQKKIVAYHTIPCHVMKCYAIPNRHDYANNNNNNNIYLKSNIQNSSIDYKYK